MHHRVPAARVLGNGRRGWGPPRSRNRARGLQSQGQFARRVAALRVVLAVRKRRAGLLLGRVAQENVEIARTVFDALNRDDWDEVFNHATPDLEMDASRAAGPDNAGLFTGPEIREAWTAFTETWESVVVEPDEFIPVAEHVVVPLTMWTRGRGGIEVPSRPTFVMTFDHGRLRRACMYQERADALEAVRLSE